MKGSPRRLVWPEPVRKGETASIGGERRVEECSQITENLVGYCQTSSLLFWVVWSELRAEQGRRTDLQVKGSLFVLCT